MIEVEADRDGAVAMPRRLAAIDMARGLALVGMVAFHADWDLAYGGWVATGPTESRIWSLLGQAVAATFLALSGYCLVLARDRGLLEALRRIGRLAATALAITAVTAWLFPQEVILFGILHCIALSSLLALPLRRAPALTVLVLAILCAAVPIFGSTAKLDGTAWVWLGLDPSPPRTLDYRPLLPWVGAILVGMAMALSRLPRPGWQARAFPARLLAFLGRHSLLIYAVHQPVLFGAVMLAMWLHVAPPDNAQGVRRCEAQCITEGAGAEGCIAACRCLLSNLPSIGAQVPADASAAALACLEPTPQPPAAGRPGPRP